MVYTARKAFAGRVWMWAHQLNSLKEGEMLTIKFGDKQLSIKKEDIKATSTMNKITFNPLKNINETQYGFDTKSFK